MHIPLKTYLESIPGFFGIRTEEEPRFEVVMSDKNGFEVRRYEPTLQAQTLVQGTHDHAMDEGFRRLAGYIFGENSKKEQMSMTIPVTQRAGDELPMHIPVEQKKTANAWEMSFVLPSELKLETAPAPRDSRVAVVEVPAKTVATLRYTGNQSEEKRQGKAAELLEMVRQHGFTPKSDVSWAQYDQPFAIPFLKRNEAHVEVARLS